MRTELVDLIRRYRRISAAELVQLTRKHKSTLSQYLQGLIASSVIREAGVGESGSRGGKPRQYLELNPDHCYAIGVDAGAARLKGGIYDFQGRQLLVQDSQYSGSVGEGCFLPDLYRFIGELIETGRQRARGSCLGVGVGFSGYIDGTRGMVHGSRAIGLFDYKLAEDLRRRFELPVQLQNDANAALLGEKWFVLDYQTPPPQNVVYLFIDNLFTSVGVGILINGTLYEGAQHFAGELNSITTDMGIHPDMSQGMSVCDRGSLSFAYGKELVEAGNEVSRRVFKVFSSVLVYVSELLNPDLLIVGGNFDEGHAFIMDPFVAYARRRLSASVSPYLRVELRPSGIVYPPVCAGAVVPLFQDFLARL